MSNGIFAFLHHISGDQIGAIVLMCIFVSVFALINHDVWYFVVSTMIGFLIADIVLTNFFIGGGGGIAQIPIFGTLARRRGHAYISYYIGIVLTTFLSAWGTSEIIKFAESTFPNDIISLRVSISVIVAILVFVDFHSRYCER